MENQLSDSLFKTRNCQIPEVHAKKRSNLLKTPFWRNPFNPLVGGFLRLRLTESRTGFKAAQLLGGVAGFTSKIGKLKRIEAVSNCELDKIADSLKSLDSPLSFEKKLSI